MGKLSFSCLQLSLLAMSPLLLVDGLFAYSKDLTAQDVSVQNSVIQDAEIDKAIETETITVLGKTYRNTATKNQLEPEETPQAISVVNSDDMSFRGADSVQQALRYISGVNTELKGAGVTMYDNYVIRGFENNQMYYDGLVLQYLKGWNLQPQIDPVVIEQVEVFKGPSSVLYGSMPPGGMVNLIAKTPQTDKQTQVSLSTGTGNLIDASIDTTGQLGDSDVYYRVITKGRHKDGQVNYTEEERYVFAPSLDWHISDNTLINVNFYYQKDPNMGMNSAMPASGSIFYNPNGKIDSDTYMGDKNWSQFEREFIMAGYKIDHQFNEQWSFLQNARVMKADLYQANTYHSPSGWDVSTGDLDRNVYSTEEESEGFSIDNQLSGFFQIGEVEHNVLFGVDYQYLKGRSDYNEYGSAPSFNVFHPNNDQINPDGLSSVYLGVDDLRIKQTGIYFQDQIRYGQSVFMLGGRWDNYQSQSRYEDAYGLKNTKIDQNEFSYRLGVLHEFDNGLSPYINYATSFEPTAGVDTNGRAFTPEMGEQIEIGVKYQFPDNLSQVTASVFHIEKSDVIVADPNSANYQDKIQVGKVRSQGFELEAHLALTSNWDLQFAYAYTDMKITEDTTGLEGNRPVYTPEHSASIWSDYSIYDGSLAGLRLGMGARYIGTRAMDAQNTQIVPASFLVDLSVGYDLGYFNAEMEGANVALTANNIFDEDSFSCYDTANCWYGQERTIELSFNYQF